MQQQQQQNEDETIKTRNILLILMSVFTTVAKNEGIKSVWACVRWGHTTSTKGQCEIWDTKLKMHPTQQRFY